MTNAVVLALLLFLPQARELAERLRSDDPAERDDASLKLKALGTPATDELRKASGSTDLEVAARAKHLLSWIDLASRFSPAFHEAFPGAMDRLHDKPDTAWTRAYLDILANPRHLSLGNGDRETLIRRALRGASKAEERAALAGAAARFNHRSAVPEIIELLSDQNIVVLKRAVQALSVLDAKDAAPLLVRLLRHEDIWIRANAIDALGRLRTEESYPALLLLLDGGDHRGIERALVELDAPRAIEDLLRSMHKYSYSVLLHAAGALAVSHRTEAIRRSLECLADPSPDVRKNAVELLSHLYAKEAIQNLRPLLKDPAPIVRATAIRALADFHDREVSGKIVNLLMDESEEVQRAAISAAGRIGAREAIPQLTAFLVSDEFSESALQALRDLRAKESLPEIAQLLLSMNSDLRSSAAEVLGELEAVGYIRALLPLLKESETRWQAAESLEKLRATSVVPELIVFLRDPSARIGAADVLGRLRAKEAAPNLVPLLQDADAARTAGRALLSLGAKNHMHQVLKLLKDDYVSAGTEISSGWWDFFESARPEEIGHELVNALRAEEPYVRKGAAIGIAYLKIRSCAQALVPSLGDTEAPVRAAAAFALSKVGTKEQAPALAVLLQDPDGVVRGWAASALSEIGDAEHIPALRKLLTDPHGRARCAAIYALQRLGAKEAVEDIQKHLADDDTDVRAGAARALGHFGVKEAIPEIARLLRSYDEMGDSHSAAATALCMLGSREGAAQIFRQGYSMEDLNALVQPDVYEKLRQRKLTRDLGDGKTPSFKLLEAEIGIPIDVSALEKAPDRLISAATLSCKGGRKSLFEALQGFCGYVYTFALEADRIRLFTWGEDAQRYWMERWSRAQK